MTWPTPPGTSGTVFVPLGTVPSPQRLRAVAEDLRVSHPAVHAALTLDAPRRVGSTVVLDDLPRNRNPTTMGIVCTALGAGFIWVGIVSGGSSPVAWLLGMVLLLIGLTFVGILVLGLLRVRTHDQGAKAAELAGLALVDQMSGLAAANGWTFEVSRTPPRPSAALPVPGTTLYCCVQGPGAGRPGPAFVLGGATVSSVDHSGLAGVPGGSRATVASSVRRTLLMVHVPEISGRVLLDSLDNNGGVGHSNLTTPPPGHREILVPRHANRFRLHADPASQEVARQLVTPELLDLLVGLGGGFDLELADSDVVVTCDRALTSTSAPDVVPRLMAVRDFLAAGPRHTTAQDFAPPAGG